MPQLISLDPLLIKLIFSLHNSPALLEESQQMEEKISAFYQGEEAIYYTGSKDSVQDFGEFMDAPQYQQLRKQFNRLKEAIKRFSLSEDSSITIERHVGRDSFKELAFDLIEKYFQDLFTVSYKRNQDGSIIEHNRFGIGRTYLFSEGKKYLEEIALLVHDETIPLAARQNAIIALLEDEGLAVCSAGCLTRLQTAAESLKYNLENTIPKQMARLISGVADEAMNKSSDKEEQTPLQNLLDYLKTRFGWDDNKVIGNAIHVKNFLVNHLLKELPCALPFLGVEDSTAVYKFLDSQYDEIVKNIFVDPFEEYIVNFKKQVTAAVFIEVIASDISALAVQKEGQEQRDFITARLQAIGEDEHFNFEELYSKEDYHFLGEKSLKITLLERLFNAGWLTVDLASSSDLKLASNYFYQHNTGWREAQTCEELPFNPRPSNGKYHIAFSNLGLSWVELKAEIGDRGERHIILDFLKEKDGLQALQQALSDQDIDLNDVDMANSLLQTPDELNRFIEALSEPNQRVSALNWLNPLLVMSPANEGKKSDWLFSGEELTPFVEDEQARLSFLLSHPETDDTLLKLKYCLIEDRGYRESIDENHVFKELIFPHLEGRSFNKIKEFDDLKFVDSVQACQFDGAELQRVTFEGLVEGCHFNLIQVDQEHAILRFVTFNNEVKESYFENAQLAGVSFNFEVNSCHFDYAEIKSARFLAKVSYSFFRGADLSAADEVSYAIGAFNAGEFFDEVHSSDFSSADLTQVTFHKEVVRSGFSSAELKNTQFKHNVQDCTFEDVDLTEASFELAIERCTFKKAKLSEALFNTLASNGGFRAFEEIDYSAVSSETLSRYLRDYNLGLTDLGEVATLPEGVILPGSGQSLYNLDICGSTEEINRRKREAFLDDGKCFISEDEIKSLQNEEGKVDPKRLFFILDKKGFSEGEVSDKQRQQFLQWAKSEKIIDTEIDLTKIDSMLRFRVFHTRFRFLKGLSSLGRGASVLTTGLIAKDMLAEFKHGDYKGLAINLGVISTASLLKELSKKGLQLGIRLAEEGKIFFGGALKASMPFLSRGPNSAFIAYDLSQQILHLKAGDREALVPVIGDGAMVGTDVVEATIEALESIGVLGEEISAITGPVGEVIAAVIMVGIQIYSAVKMVEKIKSVVHLTPGETLDEGWRAFIRERPEIWIQEAMQEEEILHQYLKDRHDDLKNFPKEVTAYFFPALDFKIETIKGHRRLMRKKTSTPEVRVNVEKISDNQIKLNLSRWKGGKSIAEGLQIIRHCEKTGRGPHRKICKIFNGKVYEKDGRKDFYEQVTGELSPQGFVARVNPHYASLTRLPKAYAQDLFCVPMHSDSEREEVYLPVALTESRCDGAMGFWNPNYTASHKAACVVVSFGSGNDQLTISDAFKMKAINFNIYLSGGHKTIHTGNHPGNVTLILEGQLRASGSFSGFERGHHTLVLRDSFPQKLSLSGENNSYTLFYDDGEQFFFNKLDNIIGSKGEAEEIVVNNNYQTGGLFIDTQGGYSENSLDRVQLIGDKETQLCIVVMLRKHTEVINTADHGSFVYKVADDSPFPSWENKVHIKLFTPSGEHFIQFDRSLSDMAEMTVVHDQVKGESILRFEPFRADLNATITCMTELFPQLAISFSNDSYLVLNKDNYHYIQRITRLNIEEAIQESIAMANRFFMTIMTFLPKSKEAILVGGFQENSHILFSSPEANKTYLVAENARGNSYIIMPFKQRMNQTVQVEIRRRPMAPTHPVIDRLDFDEIVQSFMANYPEKLREQFWIQVEQTRQGDLEVILRAGQNGIQSPKEPNPFLNLARVVLKEGVTWYAQLQVKLLNIPRKIITTTCFPLRHIGRGLKEACGYALQALPLTFGPEKSFISVNPEDVIENNNIVLEKEMEPVFYRDGADLIVTDAIPPCDHEISILGLNNALNKTTFIFGAYYTVDKMRTLVLHFANNKTLPLKSLGAKVDSWPTTVDCYRKKLYHEIFSNQTAMLNTLGIEEIAIAHRNSNPLFVAFDSSVSFSSSAASTHRPFWLLGYIASVANQFVSIQEKLFVEIKSQLGEAMHAATSKLWAREVRKPEVDCIEQVVRASSILVCNEEQRKILLMSRNHTSLRSELVAEVLARGDAYYSSCAAKQFGSTLAVNFIRTEDGAAIPLSIWMDKGSSSGKTAGILSYLAIACQDRETAVLFISKNEFTENQLATSVTWGSLLLHEALTGMLHQLGLTAIRHAIVRQDIRILANSLFTTMANVCLSVALTTEFVENQALIRSAALNFTLSILTAWMHSSSEHLLEKYRRSLGYFVRFILLCDALRQNPLQTVTRLATYSVASEVTAKALASDRAHVMFSQMRKVYVDIGKKNSERNIMGWVKRRADNCIHGMATVIKATLFQIPTAANASSKDWEHDQQPNYYTFTIEKGTSRTAIF